MGDLEGLELLAWCELLVAEALEDRRFNGPFDLLIDVGQNLIRVVIELKKD